jgi:hypothetical protein
VGGGGNIYARPGVYFIDPVGTAITAQEPPINTFTEYINLFFKYPFEFCGIYLRHFINMLNPLFGEIYIKDILKFKTNKILINYLILFIASLWIALKLKKGNIQRMMYYILFISSSLLPCLTILLGAVEERFFVPVYTYIYIEITCFIKYGEVLAFIKRYKLFIGFLFVFLFIVIYSVWTVTYANIELPLKDILPLMRGIKIE